MASATIYGAMQVFDTCIITMRERHLPVWVRVADGEKLAVPVTVVGRLVYTLDLLTSVRGISWYEGYVWDWAAKSVVNSRPVGASRIKFVILNGIGVLAVQYLMADVFDSIGRSFDMDTSRIYPVTSALPLHQQLLHTASLGICTALSISTPYTLMSVLFVTLGSSPSTWPPMINAPYFSKSLGDFWSVHWHAIYKRLFGRIADFVLDIGRLPFNKTLRGVLRVTIIFSLSSIFHLLLVIRPDVTSKHPHPSIFDISMIKFFLSQPLGLFIEFFVLVPITRPLPQFLRLTFLRLWAVVWLLWTGRWFMDTWVRRGLQDRPLVGWSPVRGLWRGDWIVS
jgi:hypothetical protein